MEEPLIIKRDEIIFRIGLYICLIALLTVRNTLLRYLMVIPFSSNL